MSDPPIIRFGIYWVNLGTGKRRAQQKRRRCVVVSPEAMHQTNMAVVCPMTTTIKHWPFRIPVICDDTPHEIMVDQIRTVSVTRFEALVGTLDSTNVQRLRDVIARMYTV